MNRIIILVTLLFLLSCGREKKVILTDGEKDKAKVTTITSPTPSVTGPASEPPPPHTAPEPVIDETRSLKAGFHPISLHWIGWDKRGKAEVKPGTDGWYSISGSQTNADKEYLNIEGRIRRISEKELEFDGIVETRVLTNNGGEPCIKQGLQRFYGKGSRTYYRLQNMENCAGGNLVDYVDIYPGTSSL